MQKKQTAFDRTTTCRTRWPHEVLDRVVIQTSPVPSSSLGQPAKGDRHAVAVVDCHQPARYAWSVVHGRRDAIRDWSRSSVSLPLLRSIGSDARALWRRSGHSPRSIRARVASQEPTCDLPRRLDRPSFGARQPVCPGKRLRYNFGPVPLSPCGHRGTKGLVEAGCYAASG